jgi:hypothetical protein
VIAPFFNVAICWAVRGCTERMTSASESTSPFLTVAPAAVKSASVACEWVPAPDSIVTSRPNRQFVNDVWNKRNALFPGLNFLRNGYAHMPNVSGWNPSSHLLLGGRE